MPEMKQGEMSIKTEVGEWKRITEKGEWEFGNSPKYYLVFLDIQEEEITNLCFGKCGKILIGGLRVKFDENHAGNFLLCREDDCPFLGKQLPEPFFEWNDTEFYLRKVEDCGKD